jgi:hypothetical protein
MVSYHHIENTKDYHEEHIIYRAANAFCLEAGGLSGRLAFGK